MCEERILEEILEDVAKQFGGMRECVSIEKRFGEGQSGDLVYMVRVSNIPSLEDVGDYILKIAGSGTKEFQKEISSTFVVDEQCQSETIRVPKLKCFNPQLAYYVYDVAGEGVKEISTLRTQVADKKWSRFKDFFRASFSIWGEKFTEKDTNLQQMTYEWLTDRRLQPDSRLVQRIRNYIHDELSEGWSMDKEVLPNPYYYLCCAALEGDCGKLLSAFAGPQHGDLNQNNILIQRQGKAYKFYLIDFSHYTTSTYLFFDQAYLFLNVLLDINGVLLKDWIQKLQIFLENLSGDGKYPGQSDEFARLFEAFWAGWKAFYTHHPRNGRTLLLQMLCACAAAGLNFMNKSTLPESKQIFSFIFSSLAVKEILRHDVGFTWKEDMEYPRISLGMKGDVSEIWKIADGFSQASRFVLISPCLMENDAQIESFCALEAVQWTAVIEINTLLDNDARSKALPRFKRRHSYRYLQLTQGSEQSSLNKEAVWCSVVIQKDSRNKALFYRRYIQSPFSEQMTSVFAQNEKTPICIIVDSRNLDMDICNDILSDLIVAAGENTFIDIINLSEQEILIDSEEYIKIHNIPCDLEQIALNIQMSFQGYNVDEIRIPSQNGTVLVESSKAADIENDMDIIHRGLVSQTEDDQGEAFYRGNEASWHDIASRRDVMRRDYTNIWHERIRSKLEQLHSSTSSFMWLYHKPGGGGSTMAKRIMWDFCTQYPTVYLRKITEQTSEWLKFLYTISVKPLLILSEVNDSTASPMMIRALRLELVRKNVRALYICVSRTSESVREEDDYNFYLPDTPQMYMTKEEACDMYRSFCSRLDPEQDQSHIDDLSDLTYTDKYSDELRQPFFYGLFAFGENYEKIEMYVSTNLRTVRDTEMDVLKFLAFNTIYSQTVNLKIQEIAYILYPEKVLSRETIDATKDMLLKNCFMVHKEDGYRISHPIIARKILEQLFSDQNYYNEVINLAKKLVSCLGRLYSCESERLNTILHELFIYREPITEEQRTVFSPFITELPNDNQRIEIIDFLRKKFSSNAHYSNHLARLYLKPLDENQWPDIAHAKEYAKEAIERSEKWAKEQGAIHHHLMGKVYSRQCKSEMKKLIYHNHITSVIKQIYPIYQSAIREFDICCQSGNSTYGAVGKLELIDGIFETINDKIMRVTKLIAKEESVRKTLTDMVAIGGDIIYKCMIDQEDQNPALRKAALRYYEALGRVQNIDALFNLKSVSVDIRVKSRRAIAACLESQCREGHLPVSYELLEEKDLMKIKNLMEENIYKDQAGNETDHFRWLEASRHLCSFDLHEAYKIMNDWQTADYILEACYYRYVISFMLYAKYHDISFKEVKQHLTQCQNLAQRAYGKNVTITKELLGNLDAEYDRDVMIPWKYLEQNLSGETRDEINKKYRNTNCEYIQGIVISTAGNMVDFRFSLEGEVNTQFLAKAPKVDTLLNLFDGQNVQFHLGFSYSGFRAWDIRLLD